MLQWLLIAGLLLAGSGLPVRARPAAGDPAAAAAQRAVAWLHAQQLPDGSFAPRMPGVEASGDAGTTADVVYVLSLLGEDPGSSSWTVGGSSALDALARLAPEYVRSDAGQAGKVARAVAAAGRDPRSFGGLDLVQITDSFYDPATGRFHPQLLFRHSLALEGLARAGAKVPDAAFDALWQARLPDGGWFWAFDGQQSDLDTTGRVMQVLGTFASAACAPALLPSIENLASHEDSAGGWGASNPPGAPNANSTGMAVAGLRVTGHDVQQATGRFAIGGQSPLARLLSFQESSGAFAYIREPGREEIRIAATVDALTALAPVRAGSRRCDLRYLPLRILG